MVINTNIEAQSTANNLNVSQAQLAKSLSRLSSGSKIIVPSDDAAGLAVSSRLNSQIKRLDSALNNVINAVSFTQTQDGFMKTIDKAFRRMGELAMLAQDTTKSDEDRALYNQEFAQLKSYVSETTKQDFNGVSLFAGKTLDVTVDADGTTFTMVGINLTDPTYTSSTNTGNDAWKLTHDAYMLSKDGYKASDVTYKTSVDLWRGFDGTWASSDNGGAKIAAGTYTTEDISTVDTAATTIAKDNFIAAGTLNAGFTTLFDEDQIMKTNHGMSTGESLSFTSNAPDGVVADTTYYIKKVDANRMTLHATLSDANANANAIDLNRTGISETKTSVTSATASAGQPQVDQLTISVAGVVATKTYSVTIDGTGAGAPTVYTMTIDGGGANNAAAGDNLQTVTAKMVATINAGADEGVTAAQVGTSGVITLTADAAGPATFTASSTTNDTGASFVDNGTTTTGVAASGAQFTKIGHNLSVGDQVTITKNAPGGFTTGDQYQVKTVSGNNFTLEDDGVEIPPTTAATNVEYTTDTVAATSNGTVGTPSGTVTVATGHKLNTGEAIELNVDHGGKISGTEFYIYKVDTNNFKIYNSAINARAGGDTGLQTFNASGAVRFSLLDSEANVATLNQSNALKKGMFIQASPLLTGEDMDAVLAKTDEVVSINKSTQDISSFANELGENYDDVNLKSVLSSQIALTLVKAAITQVATDRAKLGAVQSRLNFTNEQLTVTKENLSAAISRIADVDVAEEATSYARYQILVQSGTEMLKQANQLPQSALQLLR